MKVGRQFPKLNFEGVGSYGLWIPTKVKSVIMREVLTVIFSLAIAAVLVGCGGDSTQSGGSGYGGAEGSSVGYKAPSAMSKQMKMQEGMSRVTRSLTL